MTTQCKILPNLQLEPLSSQWYVCLPMLAPIPHAMVLSNSYIPIMQSYIESPEDHLSLSQDLSMVGGPFMNYPEDRSEEIKKLLEHIKSSQSHLVELSSAIKSFTIHLNQSANGSSLESEYTNLPEELKGYVELVYDMSNRPSLRFIESLLYKSKYYSTDTQSVCCSLVHKDQRPFVLSTPRLLDDNHLQINLPFHSQVYDDLCRMREIPGDFNAIIEKLNIPENKVELFKSFVEFSDRPKQREVYESKKLRVRYFGHACLLIEYNGISILTDPFISYDYPTENKRFTFSDLPPSIDYVLITHGHLDHIVLETLLQIRYKIKNIILPKNSGALYADPSLKLLLQYLGFNSILEVDDLEEIIVAQDLQVIAMPFLGEHHDLNIRAKAAYLITVEGKKIYVAADSSNLSPPLYDHLANIYGKIDVLFLGMECDGAPLSWFYGPLMPEKLDRDKDHSRQGSGSDFKKAIAIVDSLAPRAAYVYAMGMEPWFTYVLGLNYEKNSKQILESDKFVKECNNRKIVSERLFMKKELFLGDS
ncbi:MAG: MBL fold metallo-hydrolase [Alphaproteobacteria bacterium]|nr:MBL fold metallo-hydrolase [Alphaproteobacteria bacterium]